MLLTVKEANEIRDLLQKEYTGNMCWFQFNSCQAWLTAGYIDVTEVCDNKYVLVQPIKSYNTIVAFVAVTNNSDGITKSEFYEVGKYSRTTSKQVTQIYNSRYSYTAERIYVDRI